MVMPGLLLQKPHSSSKSCEHVICLQRRLDSWQMVDINNLIIEGRTIQHRFKQNHRHTHTDKGGTNYTPFQVRAAFESSQTNQKEDYTPH